MLKQRKPGMPQVLVEGERLYLRPLEESDVGAEYVAWLNDREVTRYLEVGKFPQDLRSIHKYLERFRDSATDIIFAIVDMETGRHIGNVTLNRINWTDRTADTGLMIGRKEFWGRGYAFKAWSLIIEYAFERLGLQRIAAGTVVDNVASLITLKKLGFKVEEAPRQKSLVDGDYRDRVLLGLSRKEFHKYALTPDSG